MKIFNVVRKSNNEVVYTYSADSIIEWNGMELSVFDHIEMTEKPIENVEEILPVRITKLAFRNRFTTAEKVTLEIASKDISAGTMQQRQSAAMIRVYLDDVNSATFIDLKRKDTRSGVLMLEQYGLIGSGRALIILDTAPTGEEIYNG